MSPAGSDGQIPRRSTPKAYRASCEPDLRVVPRPPGPIVKPGALGSALTGRETETSAAWEDRACLPAVEGIVSRNDVGAVFACQELDAVVEGLHCGRVRLALLNDVQRVPRPPAEQAVLTG